MSSVIYGAQGIALGAYKAISALQPEKKIECFLVTAIGNNASVLGGIPVRELKEFAAEKTEDERANIEVFIATPENVMDDIEKSLDAAGLLKRIRLDSTGWANMQGEAFALTGRFTPLFTYPVGSKFSNVEIYKTLHQKDKPLAFGDVCPKYLIPLQVGSALSDIKKTEFVDNEGDNISLKNGNYSELTGLYWIWKNRMNSDALEDKRKYFGLAHYRRYLELSEDDFNRLSYNDIDVVLPYPMPYEPNIEVHHQRYLSAKEWSSVLLALEEKEPEYANAFQRILKQEYLYNYNIILAKRDVFEKYCNWLFPILFRIEELTDPNGTKEPNRYMGYIGESLETLYFMYNKDNLKIAYAGCKFLT